MALPCMRTYSDGNGGGTRDANLDKGWLLQMPTELILYCTHCDLWHDTESEIAKCGQKKKASEAKYARIAKKETKGDDRVEKLESEMSEIKDMLRQLLREKK